MFRKAVQTEIKPRKEGEPIKKNRLEGDVKNFAGRKRNIPKPKIKRT
jgi:hypothetical protein